MEDWDMKDQQINDVLWQSIEPLLPSRTYPKGGRPRVPDRACLEGILFLLRTGCTWNRLPAEYPDDVTCWRRFHEWTRAGVWPRLQQLLLQEFEDLRAIDWSRGVIDSASMRALFRGRTLARIRRIVRNKAANAT